MECSTQLHHLQNALLISPQDALQVGLVNEVVRKGELEATAVKTMLQMLKLPSGSRAVR